MRGKCANISRFMSSVLGRFDIKSEIRRGFFIIDHHGYGCCWLSEEPHTWLIALVNENCYIIDLTLQQFEGCCMSLPSYLLDYCDSDYANYYKEYNGFICTQSIDSPDLKEVNDFIEMFQKSLQEV